MKLSELIEKLEELQEKCYGDPECFIRTFPFLHPMCEEDFYYVTDSENNNGEVVFG